MSNDENQSNANSDDPAWKYFYLKDVNKKGSLTCNFCQKVSNGGVYRAKWHIVGGNRNVKACLKCPGEVKKEIQEYMDIKRKQDDDRKVQVNIDEESDEEDDVEEIVPRASGKRSAPGSSKSKGKSVNDKGPIHMFFAPKGTAHTKKDEDTKKKLREIACHAVARWMYDAAIPFNAVTVPSFVEALEAVGRHGPNMKQPSYHEVRVKYLKQEVGNTRNKMQDHKISWERYGCSVMCDGWKDKCGRHLINFLVNCPKGTMFIESIDASSVREDGKKLFEWISNFIEKYVGRKNVVQVVTDNASAMKLAGKLLEGMYGNLYWTPCAAHCLDLMLEDFGKLPKVKTCMTKAIQLTTYLYRSARLLNMMRDFTGRRNLLRPAKTRFCTSFLTLSSLHKHKSGLRQMFTSEKWTTSQWAKELMGKRVAMTVLSTGFWRNVNYSLKMSSPIVKVLRLVDGEKKPAMGYLYEAMERAKEVIANAFEREPLEYECISKIIDDRWSDQLHKPLHAAGHFLNPEIYYPNKEAIDKDNELNSGLIDCITRLTPEIALQDKIISELPMYKEADGIFGKGPAKRNRSTTSPAEWWSTYGVGASYLREFAIKVLSLTCSSSGCERNWSVFEQVHSKRRNRLAQARLNDLVYVKYNRALKRRYDLRNIIDPISLKDIDESNEWITGIEGDNETAREGDDLDWETVSGVAGAMESIHNVRAHTRKTSSSTALTYSSRRKGAVGSSSTPVVSLVDEDTNTDETDEDGDGYKSYDDEEDDFDDNVILSDDDE